MPEAPPQRSHKVGEALVVFEGMSNARIKGILDAASAIDRDEAALQHVVIPASIFPLTARPGGVFTGGVRAKDGAAVNFAQVRRHDIPMVVTPPEPETPAPAALGLDEAIFGGVLFSGYGHVLLESLNRLWYAFERPELDILFAGLPGRHVDASWNLLKAFADLLQIDQKRLKLVVEPIRIKRLHVPQPGLELGLRTSMPYVRFFRSALRARSGHIQQRRRVAYISRSRLKGAVRRAFGESALDHAFDASGHAVYWPETLSLDDQIQAFNAHSSYVGFIGSHLHNLMLRYAEGDVDCVYLCSEAPNLNFLQIDMLFPGQRTYCACARYEPVFEFGNRAPFRIDREAAAQAFLTVGIDLPLPPLDGTDDTTFIEEWAYLLFFYKVFRPLDLTSETQGAGTAGRAFYDGILGLLRRLSQQNADLDALRPALLNAYDRVASAYRRLDQNIVRAGRALLLEAPVSTLRNTLRKTKNS